MSKGNTVIINGQLIDLEKVTIEELEKIEKELNEKEEFLKAKISQFLAKDES